MKRKNIKKRLAALRSGLMLSLFVISPFSVFKAANFNVIVTNEYGSFTRGNWSASILNTTYSTSAVIGELNGVYNGRVTINYSTDPTTTDLLFIPINCSMESSSNNSITIIFKNVSSFMVLIDGSGADSLQVNSMTGWNMTKLTDGTNSQLNSVLSYIDNLETLITVNNNTLDLIYDYILTLDSSNTNISLDVGDIQVDVNDIEVGIGDLLSAITSMITDGIDTITLGDILDELEQANSYLGNVNSKLTSISGYLQSAVTKLSTIDYNISQINTNILSAKNDIADLKSYVNSIVTTLNNINTALSNIDNTIDTITWKTLNRTMTFSPENVNNWQNITNNEVNITFNNSLSSALGTNRQVIFKITIPITVNNYLNNISVNIKRNGFDYSLDDVLYYDYNTYTMTIYINSHVDGNANDLILNIKSSQNYLRYTQPSTFPATIQYIDDNDIEYWQLINVFNQYNTSNKILDAINDIEINYNISNNQQTEINNITNDINNIDTIINNNVETFNDNKIDILTRLNNLERLSMNGGNGLLNRIYRVQETLYSKIFTGNAAEFVNNYLWYMLFGVLIVMLLG